MQSQSNPGVIESILELHLSTTKNNNESRLIKKFMDNQNKDSSKSGKIFSSYWENNKNDFIHKAVKNGLIYLVLKLIETDISLIHATVNHNMQYDSSSKNIPLTLLCTAVAYDQKEIACFLLQKNCAINTNTYLGTALHIAAKRGKGEILGLLLEFGADIHRKNSEGLTPFQALLDGFNFVGAQDCVARLIAYGNDFPFWYQPNNQTSPFLCQYFIIKDLLRDAQKTKPTNMVELTKALLNAYINPSWYSLTNHTQIKEANNFLNRISKNNLSFDEIQAEAKLLLSKTFMHASRTFKTICQCIMQPEFKYYLDASFSNRKDRWQYEVKLANNYNVNKSIFSFMIRNPDILNNIFLFLDLTDLVVANRICKNFNSIISKDEATNLITKKSMGTRFSLFVQPINGQGYLVDNLYPENTIYKIKEKLEICMGLPPKHQRLIFFGKELENNDSIKDYHISPDTTLHLVNTILMD